MYHYLTILYAADIRTKIGKLYDICTIVYTNRSMVVPSTGLVIHDTKKQCPFRNVGMTDLSHC